MSSQNPVLDLGLVEYNSALLLQKKLFEEVKTGSLKSALVFCRHYPVITIGRGAKKENLKIDESVLDQKKIPVYCVDRGGNVTYHGPGQLIIYPVLRLELFKKDLHYFLRRLEETVIAVLSEFGIKGIAREGLTGVWVGERKICSIGIAVKSWVSYHGLALNIKDNDLVNFSLIRPCGMDIEMISMETVLKKEIAFENIQKTFVRRFEYA